MLTHAVRVPRTVIIGTTSRSFPRTKRKIAVVTIPPAIFVKPTRTYTHGIYIYARRRCVKTYNTGEKVTVKCVGDIGWPGDEKYWPGVVGQRDYKTETEFLIAG